MKAEDIAAKLLENPKLAWDVLFLLASVNIAGPWKPTYGNQISVGMDRGCLQGHMGGSQVVSVRRHHVRPDEWTVDWNHTLPVREKGEPFIERLDGSLELRAVMRRVDTQLREKGFILVPGEHDP